MQIASQTLFFSAKFSSITVTHLKYVWRLSAIDETPACKTGCLISPKNTIQRSPPNLITDKVIILLM